MRNYYIFKVIMKDNLNSIYAYGIGPYIYGTVWRKLKALRGI